MATRVYELAKELGMSNKDMLDKLNGMGIEVSSHMNAVSDKDYQAVKNALAKGGAENGAKAGTKNESVGDGKASGEKQESRGGRQQKNRGKATSAGQQKKSPEKTVSRGQKRALHPRTVRMIRAAVPAEMTERIPPAVRRKTEKTTGKRQQRLTAVIIPEAYGAEMPEKTIV